MSGEHKCHWRIDPANGPESKGTCIFCNQEKMFSNVIPEPAWKDRINREVLEAMA